MGEEFDPQTEYEEHARHCLEQNGISLPRWDALDDYDKAEWERWCDAKGDEQELSNV